jgi:tetratricopeptide (TPR) repeat protein
LAGRHEELYVVASGRARFTVDGDELDAPRGTFVFVEPESKRGAIAEEDGTTVLVFGGTPGEAFKVSPWEATSDAWTSYQDKDYVTAADRFARVLADYPKAGGILYNLACCEALAGRGDPAVEHLRQAIAVDERFRAFARDDGDLDPIRERDDVRELLAAGDPSPPTT